MRYSKFILDASLGKIVTSFDYVDPKELEKISEERLAFCKICDEYEKKEPLVARCKLCGCFIEFKLKIIYPLDEEGKAFKQIKPDGSYIYVCPLKKW